MTQTKIQLAIGDRVFVRVVRFAEPTVHTARVIRVTEEDVYLEPTEGGQLPSPWFSRTDQTDGSQGSVRARFYTLEQWAREHDRELWNSDARMYLREQGIRVDSGSPYADDPVTVANLLRVHEGLDVL